MACQEAAIQLIDSVNRNKLIREANQTALDKYDRDYKQWKLDTNSWFDARDAYEAKLRAKRSTTACYYATPGVGRCVNSKGREWKEDSYSRCGRWGVGKKSVCKLKIAAITPMVRSSFPQHSIERRFPKPTEPVLQELEELTFNCQDCSQTIDISNAKNIELELEMALTCAIDVDAPPNQDLTDQTIEQPEQESPLTQAIPIVIPPVDDQQDSKTDIISIDTNPVKHMIDNLFENKKIMYGSGIGIIILIILIVVIMRLQKSKTLKK
jgi:hypothetical protein